MSLDNDNNDNKGNEIVIAKEGMRKLETGGHTHDPSWDWIHHQHQTTTTYPHSSGVVVTGMPELYSNDDGWWHTMSNYPITADQENWFWDQKGQHGHLDPGADDTGGKQLPMMGGGRLRGIKMNSPVYKKGGSVKKVRKMQTGGHIHDHDHHIAPSSLRHGHYMSDDQTTMYTQYVSPGWANDPDYLDMPDGTIIGTANSTGFPSTVGIGIGWNDSNQGTHGHGGTHYMQTTGAGGGYRAGLLRGGSSGQNVSMMSSRQQGGLMKTVNEKQNSSTSPIQKRQPVRTMTGGGLVGRSKPISRSTPKPRPKPSQQRSRGGPISRPAARPAPAPRTISGGSRGGGLR
jgi:hypothetical protein